MTDTPRTDIDNTRFSTPEPELDDHRNQPSSLPRAERDMNARRRSTLASPGRTDLAQVTATLRQQGLDSGEVEHAIDEDDVPDIANKERSRRGSGSVNGSPVARRGTFRLDLEPIETAHRRDTSSSSSSSSVSVPNSVEAFADPRRRARAGTIASYAGSDKNVQPSLLTPGPTHSRRPTFSEAKPSCADKAASSIHAPAIADLCFTQDDAASTRSYKIDYEELEEFVSEPRGQTPVVHKFSDHFKTEKDGKRVFFDLRAHENGTDDSSDQKEGEADNQADSLKLSEKSYPEVSRIPHGQSGYGPEPVNRFTFFSTHLNETIHAEKLSGLLMPNESFRDIFEPKSDDGNLWWLDMLNPYEEQVNSICKAFGVHPLTLEDVLTQEAREKVELFRNYYFMCFRSFYQMNPDSEDYLEPVNVYAVVFREGILTFTFCVSPHCASVRSRMGKLRDFLSLSSDWICYALMDDIVDSFGPVIRQIEREADTIEDNIFTTRDEDSRLLLRNIGECRKRVMKLTRLLNGKADVIKGFAKRCNEEYAVAPRSDVGLYLSDIQDHVVTMMSNLSHFEKMLSRSHANYLAQVQIDNVNQGNRISEAVGKVTLIATVLLPMNLLVSLFSMNVDVPGKDLGNLYWFFGIVGVLLAIVVVCAITAKRKKYF